MSDDSYSQRGNAVREGLGADVVEFSEESIYEWGPVFRARLATSAGPIVDAVVKQTLSEVDQVAALGKWQRHLYDAGLACVQPLQLKTAALPISVAESNWMAYPWVEGRAWPGTLQAIAAAGRGLGLIHRESSSFAGAGLPEFEWPIFSQESVDEDIAAITQVCDEQALFLDATLYPLSASEAAKRWVNELRAFHGETLPAIRNADLPSYAVSLDYRAVNLVYPTDGGFPVFVDFENAEVAPRLLDVALSVLLFASEAEQNPGRLFTKVEWSAYLTGYLEAAPAFTAQEVTLWPEALKYVRLEWGTWHLTEGAEWDLLGEDAFLRDLLTLNDLDRFPLT